MGMAKKEWKALKTLLIVGEGYHDEAFLNHVKRLPGACGNGVKITIKNAHGKGALNVINYAERLSMNFGYDHVAALFDADTDWTPETAERAKRAKIQVLLSSPCLEALLLRCLGKRPATSNPLKAQLAHYVGNAPGKPESYVTYFSLPSLRAVRAQESTIDDLLSLFNL
ncbi:MAG: hypothetical protein EBT06_10000 [Gammaproteobacteria bacterium]|nr:hypothetical protein [Gammaproteobacteria bacterium]